MDTLVQWIVQIARLHYFLTCYSLLLYVLLPRAKEKCSFFQATMYKRFKITPSVFWERCLWKNLCECACVRGAGCGRSAVAALSLSKVTIENSEFSLTAATETAVRQVIQAVKHFLVSFVFRFSFFFYIDIFTFQSHKL